jgi:histidyl-tRNA synthetase
MTHKIEALRGMEDILPGEIEKWQWVEEKARIFFESRGYKEIRTPILELTELFTRSVGESSDIVHKEMFSFEDRGGRNITLRPEMTASVARSIIEKGLLKTTKSFRLYYIGPMFRAERPQAGRKRQFHQIGIEMVNESGISADFEALALLYFFLKYVGVENPKLRLNDLGSAENQKRMAQELQNYFSEHKDKLCKDCLWRLEKNVLRVFDCKVESCQPLIQQAPWEKIAPLSEEFQKLTAQLETHKIPFEIKRRLVRGLDYYNGTVFEVTAEGLGAQDALAGGGRYDRLYGELGGEATPCTGFSIGFERLLSVLEKSKTPITEKIVQRKVYFAPLESGCDALTVFTKKSLELREAGIRIETLPGEYSLSKHLKKANQLGIRFVLIMGADEIKKGKWTLKDMVQKSQSEVEVENLSSYLQGVMQS